MIQEELKEYLHYNEDGTFKWMKSVRNHPLKGKKAGHKSKGYIVIGLNGKLFSAHRLVWLYHFGYLPESPIDHINRIKDDNRIENLREVSTSCNARNSHTKINNTSGICGVYFDRTYSKWASQIKINYKMKSLGRFSSKEEAVFHRFAAEQCLNWNGCNSSSDAYVYCKGVIDER